MNEIAKRITAFADGKVNEEEMLPALPEQEEEGNEGQILSRVHRYRERNQNLIKKKKSAFLEKHKKLFCEACNFDFVERYGERGKDFMECHHTKPVSELDIESKTKISDLVLLCPNCHRIVHRKKPWLSFAELKKQLESTTAKSKQD